MLLRRSRLLLQAEKNFSTPLKENMQRTMGGLPFYGNLYQGRVNPDDYQPSQYSTSEEARMSYLTYQRVYADDDPYIRVKMDKCPYFALSDMVVWHGMAPTYLDPGLLTNEEHHLMLLFSRAYYEKWKEIHSKPREVAPKPRIKMGRFRLSQKIFDYAGCSAAQVKKAQDLFVDDASFIGMNPNLWRTAHLDEKLRDHLTGRVLEFSGLQARQMDDIFELLERMRTIVVRRRDKREKVLSLEGEIDHDISRVDQTAGDYEELTFSFKDAYTVHDLHTLLGITAYSGQLKCYSYLDENGTELTVTINDEDIYFDLLVNSFFNAALEIPSGSTSPYVITVEEHNLSKQTQGRWF